MLVSLIVPPAAQADFNCDRMSSKFDATGSSPVMTVTVLPLRRFSRPTRTGWSWGSRIMPDSLRGQVHCSTGRLHTSQVTGRSSGVPSNKPDMRTILHALHRLRNPTWWAPEPGQQHARCRKSKTRHRRSSCRDRKPSLFA